MRDLKQPHHRLQMLQGSRIVVMLKHDIEFKLTSTIRQDLSDGLFGAENVSLKLEVVIGEQLQQCVCLKVVLNIGEWLVRSEVEGNIC